MEYLSIFHEVAVHNLDHLPCSPAGVAMVEQVVVSFTFFINVLYKAGALTATLYCPPVCASV